MSELTKHLVVALLKFLEDQRQNGDLSEDAAESLEVAGQCLESAYGIDLLESATVNKYPVPGGLLSVFQAGLEAKKAGVKRSTAASVADKEAADKCKAEGNQFMKDEKVTEAIDCYTQAIVLDDNNAVYYCNRAAAFNKLNKYDKAIDDCNVALEIDSKYSKAFNRRGVAQMSLHQYHEAKESFTLALQLDPTNEGYKASLEQAEHKARETPAATSVAPGGLNLGGMDFSSMLSNPALMNMATNMMSNPQIQNMMANLMMGAQGGGGGGGMPGMPGMPGVDGGAGGAGGAAPPGIGNLLQAGQQLAQQMQDSNPDLVEQLRQQMRDDPNEGGGGGSSS